MKYIALFGVIALFIAGCSSTQQKASEAPSIIASAVENRETIRPIVYIAPAYPMEAKKSGIEGTCKLTFDLSGDKGLSKPINIKVLQCSLFDGFKSACVKAVSKWRFLEKSRLNSKESTNGLITTCRFDLKGA